MYGPHTADLVDSYVAEDDVMADARSAANVLGCVPISPGVGSALRFLASAIGARAVVEVGTGTGRRPRPMVTTVPDTRERWVRTI